MCVLICANSNVGEWFDIPLARAYRQSLQLCPVYNTSAASVESFELGDAAHRRVMKRSASIQLYYRYRAEPMHRGIHLAEHGGSSRDWQKALEAITKTWGRLLSLVGLGW
jgi:hypothetical protein